MSENYIIGNNFFLLGNSFDLVLNLLIKLDSDFKILTPPPQKKINWLIFLIYINYMKMTSGVVLKTYLVVQIFNAFEEIFYGYESD